MDAYVTAIAKHHLVTFFWVGLELKTNFTDVPESSKEMSTSLNKSWCDDFWLKNYQNVILIYSMIYRDDY